MVIEQVVVDNSGEQIQLGLCWIYFYNFLITNNTSGPMYIVWKRGIVMSCLIQKWMREPISSSFYAIVAMRVLWENIISIGDVQCCSTVCRNLYSVNYSICCSVNHYVVCRAAALIMSGSVLTALC